VTDANEPQPTATSSAPTSSAPTGGHFGGDHEHPSVSVVIVNYRGADDTIACVQACRQLDWPADRLEIMVVDNASGDGSLDRLRAELPPGAATVIAAEVNTGFTGGCNAGVAAASGTYVAFINNDARPDPAWLTEAVAVLDGDRSVGCVASKVLDWEGATIDYVGAAMSFYGQAFKLHAGQPASVARDEATDVLFATGSAMVVRRELFLEAGGFDERFFMFFEDVDFGWRLWVLGHRVRYVPTSLVFHRHHASMARFKPWRETYLLERNALFTIFKNYDDENLQAALAPSLLLAVRRGLARGADDAHALDLQRGVTGEGDDSLPVSKEAAASLFAIDGLVEHLDGLTEDRRRIQGSRLRGDQEILRLFRLPMRPNIDTPAFADAFASVEDSFAVAGNVFGERRRIAVITGDTLGVRMAGPAIRAWHLAVALSAEHDVRLISTVDDGGLTHPDFRIETADHAAMHEIEAWMDVLVFQGYILHEHPVLARSSKVIVVDIYDPMHLEQLEQARDLGEERRRETVRSATEVLNQQLLRGDYFLCASDKQRDFWLGQLAAVGRVNPLNYDADESLASLITVVPFGVSDAPPVRSGHAVRGVIPGIGDDDFVILWGGGVYNWFDPLTLLRAIDRLRHRVPNVRLVFMGLKHPNPHVLEMRMAVQTRDLAAQLGLTDLHVFFNESWVPFDQRQDFLLDADVGVSTHLDHVETAFSFRTRILDYLWTSLPVVCTQGDSFGDLIEREGAGRTVAPNDVDALEAALYDLATDSEARAAASKASGRLGESMRWSHAVQPLVEFCRAPRRSPDLLDVETLSGIRSPLDGHAFPARDWRHWLRAALRIYRAEGAGSLLRQAQTKVIRKLTR
jgi:GT2 family glycosyltransferase/glycosyltransferase involved in cell wall biosynthesis